MCRSHFNRYFKSPLTEIFFCKFWGKIQVKTNKFIEGEDIDLNVESQN